MPAIWNLIKFCRIHLLSAFYYRKNCLYHIPSVVLVCSCKIWRKQIQCRLSESNFSLWIYKDFQLSGNYQWLYKVKKILIQWMYRFKVNAFFIYFSALSSLALFRDPAWLYRIRVSSAGIFGFGVIWPVWKQAVTLCLSEFIIYIKNRFSLLLFFELKFINIILVAS